MALQAALLLSQIPGEQLPKEVQHFYNSAAKVLKVPETTFADTAKIWKQKDILALTPDSPGFRSLSVCVDVMGELTLNIDNRKNFMKPLSPTLNECQPETELKTIVEDILKLLPMPATIPEVAEDDGTNLKTDGLENNSTELKIMHENRNILDLAGNLTGQWMMQPAVIDADNEMEKNRAEFSGIIDSDWPEYSEAKGEDDYSSFCGLFSY